MIAGIVAARRAVAALPPVVIEDYPLVIDQYAGSVNTAAATHNIPLPSGYAVGDLVVIMFGTRSDNTAGATVPAGWTGFLNYANTTPSPDGRAGYMYRIMDGTEGSTVSFSFADSRVLTYNVARIKVGTFDPDLSYLASVMVLSATASTSDQVESRFFRYLPSATAVRTAALFATGVTTSTLPYPSGDATDAVGTGVAATHARQYMNVGEDITAGSTISTHDWNAWGFSGSVSTQDVSLMLRGSKPLGHVDPVYAGGWALSSAGSSQVWPIPAHFQPGDMLIVLSQCETGSVSSVVSDGAFTQIYSNGTRLVHYKVLTSADIASAELTVTFTASANHCGIVLRVREGSFEIGAAPEVTNSAAATSTAPAVSGYTADGSYAGKRNLVLFFEGQPFTSTQITVSGGTYDLGRATFNSGASNAASVFWSYQFFDGTSVPGENATLNASAGWRALLVTLKGLSIP